MFGLSGLFGDDMIDSHRIDSEVGYKDKASRGIDNDSARTRSVLRDSVLSRLRSFIGMGECLQTNEMLTIAILQMSRDGGSSNAVQTHGQYHGEQLFRSTKNAYQWVRRRHSCDRMDYRCRVHDRHD